MKTVMKKLLSLALVAILLVSAVPFQASADETDEPIIVPVTVYINGENKTNYNKEITVEPGETVSLTAALGMNLLSNKDNREFVRWEGSTPGDLKYDWLKDNKDTYTLSLYIKETTPAHKHEYTGKVTTTPTCTTKGEKTYTCTNADGNCDKVSYTEEISATGHDWGEWTEKDGEFVRSCKNGCGATETKSAVKFVANGETVKTMSLKKGEVMGTLPTPKKVSGYTFFGWYPEPNGVGQKLDSSTTWDGETFTYYAKYVENASGDKDGLSYLTVRMKLYTGSTMTDDAIVPGFGKVELDDSTVILTWLENNRNQISKAIFGEIDSTKYEWVDTKFYMNDSKAELTDQATLADGDKVVFVKVHAVASTETNVQLYIHQYDATNKVYKTLNIVDVSGYKAGSTITLSKMATIVKKSYSYKSIKGLYTDTAWKQLVAGQNPTASTSLTVGEGSTVKYHVLLTNATAGSSSTADTTNPKTGDVILVPAMVMLASAAAVAFVYFGSKKRAVR